MKIRDEYIERVNKFYKTNIVEVNPKKKRKQIENKRVQIDKHNSSNSYQINKKLDSKEITNRSDNYNISPILFILPLFIFLYYLTFYLS